MEIQSEQEQTRVHRIILRNYVTSEQIQVFAAVAKTYLQHGRHEDTTYCTVEDGVTHAHQINQDVGAHDSHQVRWHSLPEVHQETLDLQCNGRKVR